MCVCVCVRVCVCVCVRACSARLSAAGTESAAFERDPAAFVRTYYGPSASVPLPTHIVTSELHARALQQWLSNTGFREVRAVPSV